MGNAGKLQKPKTIKRSKRIKVEKQPGQMLWLAITEVVQRGMVVCPEAPVLDEVLYKMVQGCAASGMGIDNDTLASLALSEAEL